MKKILCLSLMTSFFVLGVSAENFNDQDSTHKLQQMLAGCPCKNKNRKNHPNDPNNPQNEQDGTNKPRERNERK